MKILASILILFFSCNLIFGCSCGNTNESQRIEALKKTDVVFQGEVLSISDPYTVKLKNSKGKIYDEEDFINVEFKVIRAWKGVDKPRVIVQTFAKGNSCSIPFKVGQTPFILADAKPLRTNYCHAILIESERIPEILGEGKVFEEPQITPERKPETNETTESFWSSIWQKITSFFS